MFREWYEGAAASDLPVIGTLVFAGLFLLVLVYAVRGLRGREAERMASLPLADDDARIESEEVDRA